MRLLFATDLHGLGGHLRDLVGWTGAYLPDVLMVGGDALPDGDPTDPMGSQVHFLMTEMRRAFEAIKAQRPDINIVVGAGNHDWLCSYDALKELERMGLIQALRPDNPIRLQGYTLLGYWHCPPSPYAVKDFERLDCPGQAYRFDRGVIWDRQQARAVPVDAAAYLAAAPSIREDLAGMPALETAEWIFVSHAPPLETDLDNLTHFGHVGSQSIREFILERQPLLSLHGHIHESPRLSGRYWQRLGRTLAVNPGQRDDGLAAVLIDLTDAAITLTPLGIEGASGQTPLSWPLATVRRPA